MKACQSLLKIVRILTRDFFEIFNGESSASFICFAFCAEWWNNYCMECWYWSNKFTRQLVLSVVSNEGDQSSSTILEINFFFYGQNQLFIMYCTVLRKDLFQILVNFCEGSVRGSEGYCTVLASPNYFFGITQANVCIKLCIPLKHTYQATCFHLKYSGKCGRKLK